MEPWPPAFLFCLIVCYYLVSVKCHKGKSRLLFLMKQVIGMNFASKLSDINEGSTLCNCGTVSQSKFDFLHSSRCKNAAVIQATFYFPREHHIVCL